MPTSARPRIDPADVVVPEGYRAEVVMAGLSFPRAIEFTRDGTAFVAEGGSTWPTRPYMPGRRDDTSMPRIAACARSRS